MKIEYPFYDICITCAKALGGDMSHTCYGIWEGKCPVCHTVYKLGKGKKYKGGLACASHDFGIYEVDKDKFDKLNK